MHHWMATTRRVALAWAMGASVLCGVALVFKLITREAIGGLGNQDLIGLLGLFLLPVATLGLLVLDRQTVRRRVPSRTDEAGPGAVFAARDASATGPLETRTVSGRGTHAGAARQGAPAGQPVPRHRRLRQEAIMHRPK
jgi:hypothetical protein